jgi:hypothetical protein
LTAVLTYIERELPDHLHAVRAVANAARDAVT